MNIKPGQNAKVVTEIDLAKELIHVKNSLVYEVNGPTVILAQTDPPVLKSMHNGDVVVTYLVREEDILTRYGFPAYIKEFFDDYKLISSQSVQAFAVTRTAEPALYSIRMFYRVEPTSRSRLHMYIYDKKVNILDISLGGVRFSFHRNLVPEVDAIIEIHFDIDGKTYVIEARILRIWEGDNACLRGELGFASAEFQQVSKALEHVLSRKIREVERESRFNETFL
ncbi:MAG: hypothetical protein C0392_08890 [Syntrophus sp. (in: bacteria)]|nr:hypothetical protein [Syntrophus sp. (in: bacteria)]